MKRERHRRLFVVGAPRSGTTFLSAVVGAHSDVFVCEMKEPHFFGSPPDGFAYSGPGDSWVNRTWISNADEYRSLFAGRDERVLCDSSTNTLYWPDALAQIEQVNTSPIYVCVLRDPVDRIESMFFRHQAQGLEPCANIIDAIGSEDRGERAGWSPGFRYVEQSQYFAHVSRFSSVAKDRFISLTFDEVRSSPLLAAEQVWSRCGLDVEDVDIPDTLNATPHFSNPLLRLLLVRPLAARTAVARMAPKRVVDQLRHLRERRTSITQEFTADERAFVFARVADDAHRTEELLGTSILRTVS